MISDPMPSSASSSRADSGPTAYVFGPFRLLSAERRLLRDGTPVELTPKAFDTLVVLVRHAGQLVTKDALLDAVWPATVVEENYLSVNISKIRTALGETARDAQYIETVVGHGYRFRGEVAVRAADAAPDAPSPPAVDAPGEADAARHDTPFRRALIGAAVLVTLGGMLAWAATLSGQQGERSVAVLPLQAFPTAPSADSTPAPPAYLRLGIADAIITKLGNLDSIVVRPTSAVLPFQASDTDPIAAGEALNAEIVLSGFLQQTAGRLRLTMQLIDVAEARAIWSASFEAPFTDVFAVQDAIAAQVAQALTPELSPNAAARLTVNYTDDTDAYAAYLKGRYYWNQRTDEALRRSIGFYREALDRDPTYALAYLGLAEAYSLLVWYSGRAPSETFPQARAAAEQALRIDSTLAEAHATRALVSWQYDWDAQAAERHFQRALALKPNDAGAHHIYGQFLALTGRTDAGIDHLHRALTLDPLSHAIPTDLGSAYLFARRYDEAIAQYQQLIDRAPQFPIAHVFLGLAYERTGNVDAALDAHQQAIRVGGRNPLWLAELARAHALAGHVDEAEALLDELNAASARRYVSPFALALVHVALDRPQRALSLLEDAIATRDPYAIYLPVHPHLDPLRDHPRFAALRDRAPLPAGPEPAAATPES
jgi:DNA-binding winged helix-turn-helix (wHTH) protein/TolB-like protein/Flp pilus assembly protein TadD